MTYQDEVKEELTNMWVTIEKLLEALGDLDDAQDEAIQLYGHAASINEILAREEGRRDN